MSNRLSLADIDNELHEIFSQHPQSTIGDNGEPNVPATALVDIFRIFGERHGGMKLMDADEFEQFQNLLTEHPDIAVSPKVLGMFITERTMTVPHDSAENGGGEDSQEEERGRPVLGDESGQSSSSRSSSRGGEHVHKNLPPNTPLSSRIVQNPDSPFDSERRQRTAPLQHAAPSSWNSKKVYPHGRRRSDAGMSGRATSDSETGESGGRYSRPPSRPPSRPSSRATRSRAPSSPTSPHNTSHDLWGSTSPSYNSPPFSSPPMRPHSRSQSHGQFSNSGHYYDSIDNRIASPHSPHDPRDDYAEDSFVDSMISVIPMPDLRSHGSDSDSDQEADDDQTLGLVLDRPIASSVASMMPQDRLDALQRANAELARKLMEAEKTLQNRLTEHEIELEELENRLDEAKSELMAAKREEKELRAKERSNQQQISALESEILKVTKDLESSKQSYTSLQRLYQDQCAESESLRNALRHRDGQYNDAEQKISLHALEISKWQQQRQEAEAIMATLEAQLNIAREAQVQLEEQKQENLMLKETIDRMRFDMDELRMKADGSNVHSGSSGGGQSAQNSISKSLGLEILRMNNGKWIGEEGEDDEEDGVGADAEEKTAVDDEGSDGTEGEDVIQTIITKRKRKVASRAMKRLETIQIEDTKEYADAYTQHEPAEFTTSHSSQTDPEPKRTMASFSIQTETEETSTSSIQTELVHADIPLPVIRVEVEVQTDVTEPERSRSTTPDEDMASSSSTLLPPTPKQTPKPDLPPAYAQIEGTSSGAPDGLTPELRDALQKLHRGLHLPLSPIAGGVSEDALEEWAALKEEMGFECVAIDKILEMSVKTGQARAPSSVGISEDEPEAPASGARQYRRKNRFYNIYNTFVYGSADPAPPANPAPPFPSSLAQTVLILGLFGLAGAFLSAPYYAHPHYNVPGGPTYYDRAAWNEFNSMYPVVEGFGNDGVATVWDFLGRVGGGAARMARGWPN